MNKILNKTLKTVEPIHYSHSKPFKFPKKPHNFYLVSCFPFSVCFFCNLHSSFFLNVSLNFLRSFSLTLVKKKYLIYFFIFSNLRKKQIHKRREIEFLLFFASNFESWLKDFIREKWDFLNSADWSPLDVAADNSVKLLFQKTIFLLDLPSERIFRDKTMRGKKRVICVNLIQSVKFFNYFLKATNFHNIHVESCAWDNGKSRFSHRVSCWLVSSGWQRIFFFHHFSRVCGTKSAGLLIHRDVNSHN